MKNIAEYNASTPSSELYHFLAEAIIREEISAFSVLLDYAKGIPIDAKTEPIFSSLFLLIRKLYWGFFRDIDPEAFPKVWAEIVIPHPKFPRCGDLKRNLTISDVYVGILDLHGYTRFCEKNKNNLSMLQALDDMIQVEMVRLARAHDVVLQRRQGDEMVLVGARAGDVIRATLGIIGFFAQRGGGDAQRKFPFPEMHISAGIAGGKKFTPFIITRDGDLSGGVVNTAARLQSRANELSGNRSRIVVSRTVQLAYQAELKTGQAAAGAEALSFFDSGYVSFKGIVVAVSEVLHEEQDRYKQFIEKDMGELYKAIDGAAWRDALFGNLLMLLIRLLKSMNAFVIDAVDAGLPTKLGNEQLIVIAQEALTRFKAKQDYTAAIAGLERLIDHARKVPGFDRLCLEYAEQIAERYRRIAAEFDERMAAKLKEKAETTLPAKYRQLYEESRKGVLVQERLKMELRKAMTPQEVHQLWFASVEARKSELDLVIFSGKR